jgi:hypothetical protein
MAHRPLQNVAPLGLIDAAADPKDEIDNLYGVAVQMPMA